MQYVIIVGFDQQRRRAIEDLYRSFTDHNGMDILYAHIEISITHNDFLCVFLINLCRHNPLFKLYNELDLT